MESLLIPAVLVPTVLMAFAATKGALTIILGLMAAGSRPEA
jgi:hypothetical protein